MIIGAGLFGFHIANRLSHICDEVHVYEKNNEPFLGASSNNQHRFHGGFHYTRSKETLEQINESSFSFYKNFPKCVFEIENNYYLISKDQSKITTEQFLKTFINSSKKIDVEILKDTINMEKFDSAFSVPEKGIDLSCLKKCLIENVSQKNIKFFYNISNVENYFHLYDYIINASYWSTHLTSSLDVKYELCMLLRAKDLFNDKEKAMSLTTIDGQFPSIYQTEEDNEYTISSVEYTPFYKTNCLDDFNKKFSCLYEEFDLNEIASKIFEHASDYYKLNKNYIEIKKYITPKIKVLNDLNDLRTSQVLFDNKFITILQGKISTLELVALEILGNINANI